MSETLCLTKGWPEAGVAQASPCSCVCVCVCAPPHVPAMLGGIWRMASAEFKLVIFNSLTPETGRVPQFMSQMAFSPNIQSHVPIWEQCKAGWTAVGHPVCVCTWALLWHGTLTLLLSGRKKSARGSSLCVLLLIVACRHSCIQSGAHTDTNTDTNTEVKLVKF